MQIHVPEFIAFGVPPQSVLELVKASEIDVLEPVLIVEGIMLEELLEENFVVFGRRLLSGLTSKVFRPTFVFLGIGEVLQFTHKVLQLL